MAKGVGKTAFAGPFHQQRGLTKGYWYGELGTLEGKLHHFEITPLSCIRVSGLTTGVTLASAVTPSERAAGQLICLSRRSRPPSQCHPQVARFLLHMTQLDLFQPEAMSFEETREDMPVRNLELKRTSSCVHQTNIPC
jgi:hypothetical protein